MHLINDLIIILSRLVGPCILDVTLPCYLSMNRMLLCPQPASKSIPVPLYSSFVTKSCIVRVPNSVEGISHELERVFINDSADKGELKVRLHLCQNRGGCVCSLSL